MVIRSDRNAVLRANRSWDIRLGGSTRTGRPADCYAAIGLSGFPVLRTDRIAVLTLIRDIDRQTVLPHHRVPGRRLPWNAVLREYRNHLATISCRSRELQHGFPVWRADRIAGLTPSRAWTSRPFSRFTVFPDGGCPGRRLSRKTAPPRPSCPADQVNPNTVFRFDRHLAQRLFRKTGQPTYGRPACRGRY